MWGVGWRVAATPSRTPSKPVLMAVLGPVSEAWAKQLAPLPRAPSRSCGRATTDAAFWVDQRAAAEAALRAAREARRLNTPQARADARRRTGRRSRRLPWDWQAC